MECSIMNGDRKKITLVICMIRQDSEYFHHFYKHYCINQSQISSSRQLKRMESQDKYELLISSNTLQNQQQFQQDEFEILADQQYQIFDKQENKIDFQKEIQGKNQATKQEAQARIIELQKQLNQLNSKLISERKEHSKRQMIILRKTALANTNLLLYPLKKSIISKHQPNTAISVLNHEILPFITKYGKSQHCPLLISFQTNTKMRYFNRFAVPVKFMVTYCIVHLSKNEKFNHFVGVSTLSQFSSKQRQQSFLFSLLQGVIYEGANKRYISGPSKVNESLKVSIDTHMCTVTWIKDGLVLGKSQFTEKMKISDLHLFITSNSPNEYKLSLQEYIAY